MDPALANLGWTEEQWNRICGIVTEEAQRARVVAQALPLVGVEDDSATAIPEFRVAAQVDPFPVGPAAAQRLGVNSDPTLYLTTISVNVPLRAHEIADPQLRAALVMFRRAANYVVRIEDALAFYGRPGPDTPPPGIGIPPVYRVTGNGTPYGILSPGLLGTILPPALGPAPTGDDVFNQIIAAITGLEGGGASGPFACILSHALFQLVCTPNPGSLVLPRDRLLPFLQGPLLRASQINNPTGFVIALGGNPIELVVARDIGVCFLQTTAEPRQLFRVSERVALRIKDPGAIAMLG